MGLGTVFLICGKNNLLTQAVEVILVMPKAVLSLN